MGELRLARLGAADLEMILISAERYCGGVAGTGRNWVGQLWT